MRLKDYGRNQKKRKEKEYIQNPQPKKRYALYGT
jgi:hypothetical protein